MKKNIARSIHVQDFKGDIINLRDKYNDKPLLLLFYNNSCLGCTGRAIPLAHKIQTEYKQIQVIGIHSNFNSNKITEDDIKSIFTIKEIPFPIFIDENHQLYDEFECEGTPHWLLIDKNGVVINSIFGSQSNAQNRLYYSIDELIDSLK